MPALFIDRRGVQLHLREECVRIEDGESASTVPFLLVDRVVIAAPVSISSALLMEFGARAIPVTLIERAGSRRQAILPPACGADGARRVAQYRAFLDEGWRRRWSARLVAGKLRGQVRLLAAAAVARPELAHALKAAEGALAETRTRLRDEPAPDLTVLRGMEGAAAAAFFNAFGRLFAPALQFHGRNRRPPRDPVNAVLSLGYTLMHVEGVHAATAAGFDPFIGFYHELHPGRQSLACDLCELERGTVEAWTWRLFRDRTPRPEHFHAYGSGRLLGKAGRRAFYLAAEPLLEEAGKRQLRRCYALARTLGPGVQAGEEREDEDLDP